MQPLNSPFASAGSVAIHQGARLVSHHGQDLARHVVAVPGVELRARVARQRLELEIEERVDVERARLVLLEELLVARLVDLAVEHLLLDQELRPLEIAVAREQRVVEIKQNQSLAQSSALVAASGLPAVYSSSRARGTVTGRLVSSE